MTALAFPLLSKVSTTWSLNILSPQLVVDLCQGEDENLEKLLVGGIPVDGDGDPDADTGLGRQLDERSNSLLSVLALGIMQ